MAYYPKNKIKTNLTADNNKFVFVNNETIPYNGKYWERADGKYFTGATPNDPTSTEIKIAPGDNDTGEATYENDNAKVYSLVEPTENDYKIGEFDRYFIKRINQPLFNEVDKNTYDQYVQRSSKVPYITNKPIKLPWMLTGDITKVFQTNKTITLLTEQKYNALGLSLYIQEDYIKYYKQNG